MKEPPRKAGRTGEESDRAAKYKEPREPNAAGKCARRKNKCTGITHREYPPVPRRAPREYAPIICESTSMASEASFHGSDRAQSRRRPASGIWGRIFKRGGAQTEQHTAAFEFLKRHRICAMADVFGRSTQCLHWQLSAAGLREARAAAHERARGLLVAHFQRVSEENSNAAAAASSSGTAVRLQCASRAPCICHCVVHACYFIFLVSCFARSELVGCAGRWPHV